MINQSVRVNSTTTQKCRQGVQGISCSRYVMLSLDDTGVPLSSALAAFSSRRDAHGSLDADSMLEQLPFRTLIELLPQTDHPAVCSMDLSRAACTHARLRRFVADEVCFSDYGVGRNDRVAILFPNGPELAVAFVAVTKRTSPPSADTVCSSRSVES